MGITSILLVYLIFLCTKIYVSQRIQIDGAVDPAKQNFQRCTRRYTPGVCSEAVEVVWTFQFQTQNCTERLGCPTSSRTNRFKTYNSCMQRCQVVAEMYLHLLKMESANDTEPTLIRSRVWGRRSEYPFLQDHDQISEEIADEIGDQPLRFPSAKNHEDPDLEYLMTQDVDNVEGYYLADSDDLFHVFRDG